MDQLGDEILVCRRAGDALGWVGSYGAEEAAAEVDPAQPEAAALVAAVVRERGQFLQVPDGHDALTGALESAGFTHGGERWTGLWLELPAPPPVIPAGYSVRQVAPGELEARVEVHRAAWLPAALPYAPGHRPELPPDATSRFTAEHYERIRELPLYDAELDLVAVAPDRSFAACCLAWPDSELGVAEIEPLGVHPAHRRLGLAGALCLEVGARWAGRGGSHVFINNGPSERYPAPAGAYQKVGFRVVERGWTYRPPQA
jgi:GNAT superfamily N-acetyltransferase